MPTLKQVQNTAVEYIEQHEKGLCPLCGTTDGIHKILTRSDGTNTICLFGDLVFFAKKWGVTYVAHVDLLRWVMAELKDQRDKYRGLLLQSDDWIKDQFDAEPEAETVEKTDG